MKLLQYSDWKQKIAFDNVIYKDVKRYSLTLNTLEREIMEAEINYYRTNFSLLQVIKHFKKLKKAKDIEMFIKAVLKRSDNILYLPYMLKPYFRKLIKTELKDYQDFFEILLNKASDQSNKNNIKPIYKSILGEYYHPLCRRIKKYHKREELDVIKKTLKPEALINTARAWIDTLQDDLQLATIYGRSRIRKSVPISVVNEYGYGEWTSKNVSFNSNRFFIYSNNNKLTNVELEHMVYFNVYPGYGHFYNTVVQDLTKNVSFDNGATFLINGWAMYATCHSKGSMHSQNMLTEGSIIAYHLLKNNWEKSYENIYVYLLGKYPKQKAIDYMIDYSQYPAHYLSYILGEIAIELCIEKGFANNPIDFLQTLSSINCGDFFALYSPKMQRKIAKTSVTARVSKKFIN